MRKKWIFVGVANRPKACYRGFEYGRVYTESENGSILGHVGPNSYNVTEEFKSMWKSADFQMYLNELESGSI